MTQTEIIHRHAQRVRNGWPMPTEDQLRREMKSGSHKAYEAIERIQNIIHSDLISAMVVRPNPEPVPEWSR